MQILQIKSISVGRLRILLPPTAAIDDSDPSCSPQMLFICRRLLRLDSGDVRTRRVTLSLQLS